MISLGDPIEDDPVAQPAGEPDPDPRAGRGVGFLGRQHRVVERPVQMAERDVDRDAGDARRDRVLRHTR